MEIPFQLEDSELTSELLPDADSRGRVLFVESAEGGAGVLRRLQAEPEALAHVARAALELIHVDPDTGERRPRTPAFVAATGVCSPTGTRRCTSGSTVALAIPVLQRLAGPSRHRRSSAPTSRSSPQHVAAARAGPATRRAGRSRTAERATRGMASAAGLRLPSAANATREG